MHDIQAGTSTRPLEEGDVLDIYKYKTARYSFSLPLAAGWMLAGGRESVRPKLLSLGEDLGLVFQIKDDELGLFGSERTLGKPVGSDIRQGKKTLFQVRLFDRASVGPDMDRLSAVFGRRNASKQDIDFVRDLAVRLGVREDVGRVMERFGKRAAKAIRELPIAGTHRAILQALLAYSLTRKS